MSESDWVELWKLAIHAKGQIPQIVIFPDSPKQVTLHWPDDHLWLLTRHLIPDGTGIVWRITYKYAPPTNPTPTCSEIFEQSARVHLHEGSLEAIRYNEKCPTQEAVDICMRIVKICAPSIAGIKDLKWGVFGEEDGGVDIVFQSLDIDRRLSIHISASGLGAKVYCIDEDMKAEVKTLDVPALKDPYITVLLNWVLHEDVELQWPSVPNAH